MIDLILFCLLAASPRPEITKVCSLDFHINPADLITVLVTEDRIFATALLDAQIYVFDRKGKALPVIGVKGQGPGELLYPGALAYDAPFLYASDSGKQKIIRIDPTTGKVVAEWPSKKANKLIVKGDKAYLSYTMLHNFGEAQGNAIMASAFLREEIEPEHFYFSDPCCLKISGTKYAGILLDSKDHFWAAYTGDYRLEKYAPDGRLIKRITREPPDFASPEGSPGERFNRGARSAHFMSFDKVKGLFEVDGMVVLHRFKVMDDARLDLYDLEGTPIQLGLDISGVVSANTLDGELYGYRRAPDDSKYDMEIVKINLVRPR
jgi:hypothetical protein